MKKVSLFLLPLFMAACSTDKVEDIMNASRNSDARYDENNYQFNTINLWGSEAAVYDMGDSYLFQGDIVLKKSDIDSLYTRGAARTDTRWPDNKVYYTLTGVPELYRETIYAAISEIEFASYLKFIPRLNDEKNYINIIFKNTDEWIAQSDYIGMKSGKQEITLSKDAAEQKGVVMHEICHALGLYHEMCRSDRDKYIKIDFSGMTDKERHQYKTYKELGQNGVDVGLFDFQSIMLYDSYLNNRVVMTKLDGSIFYAQRQYLTKNDIEAIAKAQPAVLYTFYTPLVNDGIINSDYQYQRVKYLRCPEGANIRFKFQQKFSPSSSTWNGYNLSDFNIKTSITIVEKGTNNIVFSKDIQIKETSGYEDTFFDVNIPKGTYTTKLRLSGSINGASDTAKRNTLKQLLYNPSIYFHLDNVLINNINVKIPSDFSYPADIRTNTFMSI